MTFSYDPTLSTDLDLVRFTLDDTDETAPFFQDEELGALLDQHGTVLAASIDAAERLAARLRQLGSLRVGDVSIDADESAVGFERLAERLRAEAGSDTPVPAAGGIGAGSGEHRAARFVVCGSGVPRRGGWPC